MAAHESRITDADESRIMRFREILKNTNDLTHNKSFRPEDLQLIQEFWSQQEECLKEAKRGGRNPSMQEMILDLQIMYSTGSYLGQHIRELQTNVTQFSPMEFAEKLFERFSVSGKMEWSRMGKDAVRIINRAPGVPILLGTFAPTSDEVQKRVEERNKKTNIRVSKDKEALATKQIAGKVENMTEDKNSVDKKVDHIMEILQEQYRRNHREPVNFYRFILHPQNFTTTVENIFYISFIIRDGKAALAVTETNELVIYPLKKEGKTENSARKNQMVFSITMDEWRNLVAEYQVQQPCII